MPDQPLEAKCTLAVLITCYNRKQQTLSCLEALLNQYLPSEVSLNVYLVDDGSTDGTSIAVQQTYPQVRVVQGNGKLFWNGGMRLAFEAAMQQHYNFYLWLNDDTLLYPGAINRLFTTVVLLQQQQTEPTIVVGSTQDLESGALTYGGVKEGRWWHPFRFQPIEPGTAPQTCHTMNGNCVLIPASVVQRIGNLDASFCHYMGDYDYGLRAGKAGCQIWIASGYVGTCVANPAYHGQTQSKNTQRYPKQYLQQMSHPKGLSLGGVILYPFQEWFVFTKRHGGLLWFFFWLLPYRRLIHAIALLR